MCYSFRIRPFCVVVTCGYRSISLLAIYCTLIDASLRRTINLWLFCVFSFILIKKLCPRHSFNLESVLNQTVSMTASFWNTFLKQFLMNKLWWDDVLFLLHVFCMESRWWDELLSVGHSFIVYIEINVQFLLHGI